MIPSLGVTHEVVGIEDQEGCKGTACTYPSDGQTITFASIRESAEIRELVLKLTKSDGDALIYFDTGDALRGCNLQYTSQTPENVPVFGFGVFDKAIGGYATLLISSVIGATLGPVGGIMFGITRIGLLELAPALARAQWPVHAPDREDAWTLPGENFAYLNASADYAYGWPVDATLSAPISWVFTDENTVDHSVSITAELRYYSYITHQIFKLQTQPLTLRFLRDAGNIISDSRDIGSAPARVRGHVGIADTDDYFRFHVSTVSGYAYHKLDVTMAPPLDSDFDLELYSGSQVFIGGSHNTGAGALESIPIIIDPYDGYFYARVRWKAGHGFYNLTISLQPYVPPSGGGAGGGGMPPGDCMEY
jgi:hypothetical protein